MDRQYTIKESDVERFRDYANSNGWAYKSNNNHHSFYNIVYKNSEYKVIMKVQVDAKDYENYPYLDTFRVYDPRTGILLNDGEDAEDRSELQGCYLLESTGGGYTEIEGGVYSEWYDERIPEDQAVWSDYLNDWLWRMNAVKVENGSSYNQGWYSEDDDDLVYDEYNGYHLNRSDATYCDSYGEYVDEDTVVSVVTDVDSDGRVDSDGYYWEGDDDLVKLSSNMNWYEFLSDRFSIWRDFNYIHSRLLIKDYKENWILEILEMSVYKLKEPIKGDSVIDKLTPEHALLMGLEIDRSKSYIIDKISYYINIESILEEIYNRAVLEVKRLEMSIENKGQLRIKFSDEDHKNWIDETNSKIRKLKNSIDEIEYREFLDINFDI
jgi:hypothetical protein